MAEHNEPTFRRLLVPLDGSRMAESVLPLTKLMATRLGAEVVLLHIMEQRPPANIHGDRHLSAVAEATGYLDAASKDMEAAGIAVSAHVHEAREGDVARSIVEHANEFSPDLVILCAHGRGGLRGLLFGGIAQQVLSRGLWPILLVQPNDDGSAPHFDPCSILVPLDTKHEQELPLDAAAVFGKAFDATVHLVVVSPTMQTLSRERAGSGLMLPRTMKAILELTHENDETFVGEIADRLRARGVDVKTEVTIGDAVTSVPDIAARLDVDLIVMASHGRAGLKAILSDSVAPRIVARVRRPLLLMKV